MAMDIHVHGVDCMDDDYCDCDCDCLVAADDSHTPAPTKGVVVVVSCTPTHTYPHILLRPIPPPSFSRRLGSLFCSSSTPPRI